MYQYKGIEDTVVAIATPMGQGAIGIVRISGQDALLIAGKVLRLKNAMKLVDCQSHGIYYGWVIDEKSAEIIDEVLVLLMKAPQTYTGQHTIEINCHGGSVVLNSVLNALLKAGARLALPGEFTQRAFLNGRIDLIQAEAVIDIIQAKTEAFVRQSQHQLKGELSVCLNGIRDELVNLYTLNEALINFPEDGIDAQARLQMSHQINVQIKKIEMLLDSARCGRILKEGVRIVLCGRPNVGKSSLLNAMLKEQRAIVTDIAGTTRDVLEESAQIKGMPIALVDTAGILEPRDLIEEEAVKRSQLFIKSADMVLLVLDSSQLLETQDKVLIEQLTKANVLVVVNKVDLPRRLEVDFIQAHFLPQRVIHVSAYDLKTIQDLETRIAEIMTEGQDLGQYGILISNSRHIESLRNGEQHLKNALKLIEEKTSLEFIAEELKTAVNHLDAVTGRNIDADLLERVFSQFCIGK